MLAHGSSMCFLQTLLYPAPEPPALPAARQGGPEEQDGDPDPHLRPAAGQVLGEDVWRTQDGLEVLRKQLAGSLALAPIHHLTCSPAHRWLPWT